MPSFVVPGTIKDNVHFLNGLVGEIGLCFFESRACLAYTEADIPSVPECGNLRFHVHLPLDLVWPDEASKAGDARHTAHTAFAVLQKAEHLTPRYAVLHVPKGNLSRQRNLLATFVEQWQELTSVPLLLENSSHCSVASLGRSFLENLQTGFCLDTGHLLAYGQNDILTSDLLDKTILVHWSAPGKALPHRHLSLKALACNELQLLKKMVPQLAQKCTHMLEIFSWNTVLESLPVLRALLGRCDDGDMQ